ncbi:MAG: sugar ABC transporter substrate-binding protein, partial [Chloroflexota bacterium]
MSNFRKFWLISLTILGLLLAACGGDAPQTVEEPAAEEEAAVVEEAAEEVVEEEMAEEEMADGEKVVIRWYVGLGAGGDEAVIPAQEAVVETF